MRSRQGSPLLQWSLQQVQATSFFAPISYKRLSIIAAESKQGLKISSGKACLPVDARDVFYMLIRFWEGNLGTTA